MCLYVKNFTYEQNDFRKKLQQNGGKIRCWKVLNPSLMGEFYPHNWTSELNQSNRKSKKICYEERIDYSIFHGFHVYTTRKEAQKKSCVFQIILPVICDIKDFVAYSSQYNEAVFTKVFVNKQTWTKINKRTL